MKARHFCLRQEPHLYQYTRVPVSTNVCTCTRVHVASASQIARQMNYRKENWKDLHPILSKDKDLLFAVFNNSFDKTYGMCIKYGWHVTSISSSYPQTFAIKIREIRRNWDCLSPSSKMSINTPIDRSETGFEIVVFRYQALDRLSRTAGCNITSVFQQNNHMKSMLSIKTCFWKTIRFIFLNYSIA